jgi:hypothetical protein
MWTRSKSLSAVAAAVWFATIASVSFAAPANAAAVYCKTAGVPKGCVVRPTPVVVAPAPIATATVARVGYYRGPVAVRHVGYTRVTPYGVRHVGYTRVRR